jgi:cytochrome c oxidase subunit IV
MSEPTPTPPSPAGRPVDDHISTAPHMAQPAETHLPVQVSAPGAPAIHAADYAAGGAFHDEDPTHLKLYCAVFAALCVCTLTSFLFNQIIGQNHLSAALIAGVSVIKAALVAWIFMHLKADWRRVYGIMLPVCIMAVMMTIIFSIDQALVWPREIVDPAAVAAGHH